jgi:hypothetical protein
MTSKPYTVFAAGRSRPAGLISVDGSVYARRSAAGRYGLDNETASR